MIFYIYTDQYGKLHIYDHFLTPDELRHREGSGDALEFKATTNWPLNFPG